MNYLILGVNGMAGHMIAKYLIEQGQDVSGFARSESYLCKTYIGDVMDQESLLEALYARQYDYVVNAVGVLNQFVDKNLPEGIYINSVLPHFLAKQLDGKKTKLIHISTDCVFEGIKGRYTEDDQPDATSYYGRSKALGEVVDNKNLTIRTSIVGPELKNNGIGLFHWFMSQEGPVNGYERVMWSGVTTLQLAKAIFQDATTPQVGLYHLVNNEFISKHQLLLLFNRYCRKHPVEICGTTTVVSDKTLLHTKGDAVFAVPGYEEMIKEMADWIKDHSELYQQYQVI